jgi:Ca2+-binding EF-hand superfamily protein
MEVCPWRAEDEGVLLLRHNLSQALGSKEAVFEALDTNKDGRICFQELKKGLEKLAIDIKQVTGGVELNRIYNLLDHDLSGELSLSELLEADCRKEAQFRDDIITQLRTDLLAHFGDNESLLTALDANSNGELSLLEMKQGFKDARFNASGSISGASLSWVFKVLDADGSGSLSIHELMVQDPADDAKRFKEARRPRFNKRREQNALSGGRRKSAADCDDGIPELSPRRVEDLTPALQKVALFGKEVVKSAEQRRVSLAEWGAGTLASDPRPRPLEMQVLDLSNCFIERDGAARLAHALLESRMDKLEVLELSGNYIGPEGVTWISSSIQKHTSLRLLGLAWNLVDDDGAKRLSTLARKVRTLNELDLRFNRIGDDGALQLSKLLASKSRFTRLDLGYNQIEKEGCSKCVSAARKNKTTLILQGNLGHKGTVLAHKGNPVVAAPYGGMMLPKIKDLVVAGWPRSGVSRDGPRKKKGKPGSKPGSALAGDAPRTASALGRMMPQPWPPSIELSRSMTEAKLQGISPARAWSREACTKHSLPGLEDAFPGPSRGQRRQLGTS